MMNNKDKKIAGLLAILLGGYSAHYFYLGSSQAKKRLILALVTFGVMACYYGIMGIIDGIKIFKMTDEEFAAYAAEMGGVAVEAPAEEAPVETASDESAAE